MSQEHEIQLVTDTKMVIKALHALNHISKPVLCVQLPERETLDVSFIDIDHSQYDSMTKPEMLNQQVISMIEQEIRNKKPESITVAFRAYLLRQEEGKATPVIVIAYYNETTEKAYHAVDHGDAIGQWFDLDINRIDWISGLWSRALSYQRN